MKTVNDLNECQCCGMIVDLGEYHPYAACLMFRESKCSNTVRENLKAVRDVAVEDCAMVADGAHKDAKPAGIAKKLRELKGMKPATP